MEYQLTDSWEQVQNLLATLTASEAENGLSNAGRELLAAVRKYASWHRHEGNLMRKYLKSTPLGSLPHVESGGVVMPRVTVSVIKKFTFRNRGEFDRTVRCNGKEYARLSFSECGWYWYGMANASGPRNTFAEGKQFDSFEEAKSDAVSYVKSLIRGAL